MASIAQTTVFDWESHRAEIEDLWLKRDMPLPAVIRIMAERHGFHAGDAQYRRRLKKWHLRKNVSDDQWKIIGYKVEECGRGGKSSQVSLDDRVLPEDKVQKEISRHAPSTQEALRQKYGPAPLTPEGISICTPPPQPEDSHFIPGENQDAALYLPATQDHRNEDLRWSITECFQYYDVPDSITSLDRRPGWPLPDLQLPGLYSRSEAGGFLGILDGLFKSLSDIVTLRDRIRHRRNQHAEPTVDHHALVDALSIDSSLRSWQPRYPLGSTNWLADEVYRWSAWVYLCRTIHPSRPNIKFTEAVENGLEYLDKIPPDAGAFGVMLAPLFLLGCSAFELYQRRQIAKAFDLLEIYSNRPNIKFALRAIEEVWKVMDTHAEMSWDWETIIDNTGLDFLVLI